MIYHRRIGLTRWVTPLLSVLAMCFVVSAATGESPFVPPSLPGKRPWTDKAFKNRAEDFQFVIMSDRTGGMRRGVFADAADKVNLLQPEFVMSVGDLIDGYTEDESLILDQWEEFDAIVERLEMPFFHVAGNHDVSNDLMLRRWHDRLGPDYYHFTYHDVLFLCLDSEPLARIDEEQVAYVRNVIAENQDVRWTLVFLHRPLWELDGETGFEKIEALLAARPYTVFAGHQHVYRKTERHGIRYITFATTGGGSPLRGVDQIGRAHV